MTIHLTENNVTAHYERRANKLIQDAVEWECLAESASRQEKSKYLRKASECRRKFDELLELAKLHSKG